MSKTLYYGWEEYIMRNLCFRIILNISVIVFCLLLVCCGINKNKINILENTDITETQLPMATMQTENNVSPSNSNIDLFDYIQYTDKIWVVEDGEIGNYTSFYITKIENGVIEGEFFLDLAMRSTYYHVEGKFSGSINNGVAECQFIKDNGFFGIGKFEADVALAFKDNNLVEVNIEYIKKWNDANYKNGIYRYRPYNLTDLKKLELQEARSFSVDLDYWGNVNIVTGIAIHKDSILPTAYLTDLDGNILYKLDADYQFDTEIIKVTIEDMNGDGVKDIKIITATIDNGTDSLDTEKPQTEWIFYQLDNGFFCYSSLDAK